jgi:hypothetical protein
LLICLSVEALEFRPEAEVHVQEEKYVHAFTAAISAQTNTVYTAGTAAQNALSLIGKFDSVASLCQLLQYHFQELEKCASSAIFCCCDSMSRHESSVFADIRNGYTIALPDGVALSS